MQNTTENPKRGENTTIAHIDELAFYPVPAEAVDAPAEKESEIANFENFVANTKGELSDMIEGLMSEMRSTHEQIIADPEAVLEQVAASQCVIDSIDLVQNDKPVIDATEITAQLNTVSFMKETILTFRRHVRRNRIPRLDVQELSASIRKINDPKFRMKLILMLNAVMIYAMKDPKGMKKHTVFLRFQFMIIKFAAKLGYVPVMAGLMYERYSDKYHNRS